MKSAAIFSKPAKPELAQVVPELLRWFQEHDYKVVVDHETAAYASGPEVVERSAVAARSPKFVVVLGGDGTLLAAARAVARAGIPVLGVNLGSLGFLTEVPLADLYSTLTGMDQNKCGTELRSMLDCQLLREGKCVAQYHALNDVVVNKSAIARLADFDPDALGGRFCDHAGFAACAHPPSPGGARLGRDFHRGQGGGGECLPQRGRTNRHAVAGRRPGHLPQVGAQGAVVAHEEDIFRCAAREAEMGTEVKPVVSYRWQVVS
jgi:hypothetical protein